MRKQILLAALAVAIAAFTCAGRAGAEMQPSSDVLVPYFEVDLEKDGRTTLFAVCNGSDEPVDVMMSVHTNWGIPVLDVPFTLDGDQVQSVNLRDWLVRGILPGNRTLDQATIDHLAAALSGRPSPRDERYYSTAVTPGLAVGYVEIRTAAASRPDVLWGDYFVVDPLQNYAQGDTLVNLDHARECQGGCFEHVVRFLEGAAFTSGTEILFWTSQRWQPSVSPQLPAAALLGVEMKMYAEDGHMMHQEQMALPPVAAMAMAAHQPPEPFGWLDLSTERESWIGVRMSAEGRYSAAFHSYCVEREESEEEGPGLTLAKLTDGAHVHAAPGRTVAVGDPVAWEYVVRNTGAVRLTGVQVFDDQVPAVACPQAVLEPGESMRCTASGVAAACQYHNVGTAVGTPPTGGELVAQDEGFYWGDPGAAVTLEKRVNGQDADTPPGPSLVAGQPITWTYAVTNAGRVRLTNLQVVDDHGVVPSCPKSVLEPAESMVCTATGTAVAGPYVNIGRVTAAGPCGEVAADDPAHHFVPAATPGITLEKLVNGEDADSAPGPWLLAGSTAHWTYVVTNVGNVRLTPVSVSDDHGVAVTCPQTALEPGESMTCTGQATVTPGQYCNVGTAAGTPPAGQVVQKSDIACHFGHWPAIALEKFTNGEDADAPTGPVVLVGSAVTWTYKVTNAGDVTLSAVAVSDDRGVTVTCPKTVLAPLESMTCSATGTAVAGQYANLGTAVGTPPAGPAVQASDPSHYYGEVGAIDIEKLTMGQDADTPPGPTVEICDTSSGINCPPCAVEWTYIVTNTGQVPITQIVVTDDKLGVIACPKTTLAPGASMTCTKVGTPVPGQYGNIGTATGQTTGGTVEDRDPSHYFGHLGQG
jgi:hypothetical protein